MDNYEKLKHFSIMVTTRSWWYCNCSLQTCSFVCFTTTHTHALEQTKRYGEETLRILRRVCMKEIVMDKLTLEQGPVESYLLYLLH